MMPPSCVASSLLIVMGCSGSPSGCASTSKGGLSVGSMVGASSMPRISATSARFWASGADALAFRHLCRR